MVVHFKQSIKKLNEKKRKEQELHDTVSEIQDAMIEIAGIVSDTYAAVASSENKEGGENG